MKFVRVSSELRRHILDSDLMSGLVYYNYTSDIIFVRVSIHDFGGYHFDILERVEFENCILLGVL